MDLYILNARKKKEIHYIRLTFLFFFNLFFFLKFSSFYNNDNNSTSERISGTVIFTPI